MNNPKRRTNNGKEEQSQPSHQIFQQGGYLSPKCKVLLLCVALLNVVLLISAIVIGMMCANFKQDSPISELKHLRHNCSNVQLAEEEARGAIQKMKEKHSQLKVQLEQLKSNEDLLTPLESLQTEREGLQTNISSLEESCGKCPPDWVLNNSSCYYFSIVNSSSSKKNWHDSRADCISRGSDLTVIDSPDEQKYLNAKVIDLLNGHPFNWAKGFWVGLTDFEKANKRVWIHDPIEEETRYRDSGDPNIGDYCAVIVYHSTSPLKKHYDAGCKRLRFYWLCETHVQ